MTNLGGPNAGSITAALFLEEFVAETTTRWIPEEPTGFGSRLLVELAPNFEPSAPGSQP